MADFFDLDGKVIVPGSNVLVACSRRWGGSQLVRGTVYRTQLRGWNNKASVCVEYKDADGNLRRRAFMNPKAMLVVA